MAEDVTSSGEHADKARQLRDHYHQQTAQIAWRELQTFFAQGKVIQVVAELDLVDVAVQLSLDNADQFQRWIDGGDIAPVSDAQAGDWFKRDKTLWAVVAAPWVLVQDSC